MYAMATLAQKYKREDTFWRRWAAVFILFAFFFLSWGGQYVNQMQEAKQQSEQHGQVFQMSEFMPQFWSATFENWQSEWLQLAVQAILIAALADYLFRIGYTYKYETQMMIEDLNKEVKALQKKR